MKATERQKEQFKERYQKNKETLKLLALKNYEENKEQKLRVRKEYVKNNPEKLKLQQRNWYLKNRESKLKKSCEYVKNNKLKHTLYNEKRRANKNNSCNKSINEKSILELLINQKNKCVFCKTQIEHNFHIDHIIPLSKNGLHIIENIQLLCPTCNLRKGNKNNIEFNNYLKTFEI